MQKAIYTLLVVLFASSLLFTTGCKRGADVANSYEELKSKACACKDKECAQKAWGDFKKLYYRTKDAKVGSSAYQRIKNASNDIGECVVKQGIKVQEIFRFSKSQRDEG
jgi:hypothetical protein